MKGLKLFAAAAMIAACTTASARSVSENDSISATSFTLQEWRTSWFQYIPTTISPDGGSNTHANAISLGSSSACRVAKSIPLFLEAGLGIQYSWASEDGAKLKWLSLKIPVDVMYGFRVSNSSTFPITILPYVGLNFRINLLGMAKYDDHSLDLFDKGHMGDDGVWKRFQVGWRAGVKSRLGKDLVLGVGYGHDFSKLCQGTKIGEWTLQLGFTL